MLLAQAPGTPPAPPLAQELLTPPEGTGASSTGLRSVVLRPGTGTQRLAKDGVAALGFTGWDSQGVAFTHVPADALAPRVFVERLMPGMREALLQMAPGERRRLWIPESLAFAGAEGKPKGTVVMELELIDALPNPKQAPEDVAGPGPDAVVLRSGLATKVLRPGTGGEHPRRAGYVVVHYTGWTTDGKMFDSSVVKRSHELIRLTEVIEGWREGIPLMTPGERRRFWVPQHMAYRGEKGMPKGMLVFDVELLSVPK